MTLTPIPEGLAVELSLLFLSLWSVAAGIQTPNLSFAEDVNAAFRLSLIFKFQLISIPETQYRFDIQMNLTFCSKCVKIGKYSEKRI